jgi:hypothetical protein
VPPFGSQLNVKHVTKEEGNFLHTIRRKANWICHILRKNCLLKHVIEGKIEEKGRRGKDVSSYLMIRKRDEIGN